MKGKNSWNFRNSFFYKMTGRYVWVDPIQNGHKFCKWLFSNPMTYNFMFNYNFIIWTSLAREIHRKSMIITCRMFMYPIYRALYDFYSILLSEILIDIIISKPKLFWSKVMFSCKINICTYMNGHVKIGQRPAITPTWADGKIGLLADTWGRTTPGVRWRCTPLTDPDVTTGALMLEKLKTYG